MCVCALSLMIYTATDTFIILYISGYQSGFVELHRASQWRFCGMHAGYCSKWTLVDENKNSTKSWILSDYLLYTWTLCLRYTICLSIWTLLLMIEFCYFKLCPLLTQVFGCKQSLCNLHRKAEQQHMCLSSQCPIPVIGWGLISPLALGSRAMELHSL